MGKYAHTQVCDGGIKQFEANFLRPVNISQN